MYRSVRTACRKPDDRGVAVYFTHLRRSMCFTCDKWDQVEDNLYAIVKTIETLRGIERWGVEIWWNNILLGTD